MFLHYNVSYHVNMCISFRDITPYIHTHTQTHKHAHTHTHTHLAKCIYSSSDEALKGEFFLLPVGDPEGEKEDGECSGVY